MTVDLMNLYRCKIFNLNKQKIIFEDLGIINYKAAWDYQEELVKKNLDIKSEIRKAEASGDSNSRHNFKPSFILRTSARVYTW